MHSFSPSLAFHSITITGWAWQHVRGVPRGEEVPLVPGLGQGELRRARRLPALADFLQRRGVRDLGKHGERVSDQSTLQLRNTLYSTKYTRHCLIISDNVALVFYPRSFFITPGLQVIYC